MFATDPVPSGSKYGVQVVESSWPFLASLQSCWRTVWPPTLRTIGQCLFGIAMMCIIAGIALCIWGYLGEAIRPFQIFGPVCIGGGLGIYVIGCILCCREYPSYEKNLLENERQEKARKALNTLSQKEVIEWLQGEPELYEEFRQISAQILNTHGFFASDNDNTNVIANLYVNKLCAEV